MRFRLALLRPACFAALVAAAGCATSPTESPMIDGWQAQLLPGKSSTRYEWADKEGRRAVRATASHSASLWRKRVSHDAQQIRTVSFSWWVQDLMPVASVADSEREDAPARVMFGFDGDKAKLSLRARMLFDLAEALTGEAPPYATLAYVWDAKLPVGTVVTNPRTDRIRSIVVDSGPEQLRRWRDHRRDLAADFRLAFGEEPGALLSIALMTDSDNTRAEARAWYGPVELK